MVNLSVVKISKPELPELVLLAFDEDKELIKKYHIVNGSLNECVKNTLGRIDETANEYQLKYYKVLLNKKAIGFFVAGGRLLYSFGIGIKFRKSDILKEWWSAIKKEIGVNFIVMLYKKNERAIKFCQKQGMILANENNNVVTLLNK